MSSTANNIPEYSYFPLLKSFLKVFSLFEVQFQFDNNVVTEVCIKCNSCNKIVTCQISETVMIDILPSFIKDAVFHHVGLPGMIETKEPYKFSFDDNSMETICQNLHASIFEVFIVTACQDIYN